MIKNKHWYRLRQGIAYYENLLVIKFDVLIMRLSN